MGPFPASICKKYILVAADYVSKWTEVQALPINDTCVVVKFIKWLFSCFGMPNALISDRGAHFFNKQHARVLQKYRVHHRFATPYHPQRNIRKVGRK